MAGSDRGLQPERTRLAWQRTALSLVAASAVLARIAYDRIGLFALISLAVTVPAVIWAYGGFTPPEKKVNLKRDGVAPLLISGAIVVVALTALAAIVA